MNTDNIPEKPFQLDRDFINNPLMTAIKLARYKFVYRLLSQHDSVLDLGCGNGYSSYFFSKVCRRVRGVDLYADLDKASEIFSAKNLSFFIADLLQYRDNEKYSVITMIDVIEHFTEDGGKAILSMYSEKLAPNGMMIVGTPNKYSGNYRSDQSRKCHLYEYGPEELRQSLSNFFSRVLLFSMNDEVVHTGFHKMAWFLFGVCMYPRLNIGKVRSRE